MSHLRMLAMLAIAVIVIASAYNDLQNGTIPHSNVEDTPINNENNENNETNDSNTSQENVYYEEVKVEAGQTVYEIVQSLHEEHFTEAPHRVVVDFEALNPNVSAHEIIIGHTYRFPIYSDHE